MRDREPFTGVRSARGCRRMPLRELHDRGDRRLLDTCWIGRHAGRFPQVTAEPPTFRFNV
ncbi:hypothetical protein GCM10010211_01220 [Streptomyces albospinus]|uniref:Uncharacterized protein n=1 Tax=Streptomyces albospinus TaxID=285515 RepID=A0ABQ2UK45_9ACTN|nr:hypothetical protein GCM10010211_01220 [Streptomyces albospinus]